MMRKCVYYIILLSVTFFYRTAFAQDNKAGYTVFGNKIAAFFLNEQFDSIVTYFDATMKRQLSVSQLSDTWTSLQMQFGEVKQFGSAIVDLPEIYYLIKVPIEFEKSKMQLQLSVDTGSYTIAGLYFTPTTSQYNHPDYVNTLSFVEHKVSFGKAPYVLYGVLSVPVGEGKFPLAIIVHGSGPQDMDGTQGANKVYKDMAWGLASKGVAVFRYSKRTYSHALVMMAQPDANQLTYKQETTDDAIYAIEALATHAKIDDRQIYILGHSFGGMMSPYIAQHSKKVKGVIMAAGNARPLPQLLVDQMHFLYDSVDLPEGKRGGVDVQIAKAEYAMRKDLKPTTPDYLLPANIGAPYWIALNKYDQVKTMKKLKRIRKLFLQGERDYQVTLKDFAIWEANFKSDKQASFVLYPKLNHLFMQGEGKPNYEEYEIPGSVDEKVISDIVRWIKEPLTKK